MTLGEKLREARKQAGLTQEQVAMRTGISKTNVANYEGDRIEPSFFKICCIANLLGLSLNYLAGWKEGNKMTNEEAKQCLYSHDAVAFNGTTYDCITAIIYRVGNRGELIVSAELLDKNRNSVTIAQLKDVKKGGNVDDTN